MNILVLRYFLTIPKPKKCSCHLWSEEICCFYYFFLRDSILSIGCVKILNVAQIYYFIGANNHNINSIKPTVPVLILGFCISHPRYINMSARSKSRIFCAFSIRVNTFEKKIMLWNIGVWTAERILLRHGVLQWKYHTESLWRCCYVLGKCQFDSQNS